MKKFDKTMLVFTLFAFSLSMLVISLDSFNIAGAKFSILALYALGIVAAFVMLLFFVLALFIAFSKKI